MATSTLTSPGLIKAVNEAIVKATPDLNQVRLFAYDMSGEFAEINQTVKVPVITAGTVASFDESTNDYENATGSIAYADIKLTAQPKVTMAFKGSDLLEAPNAPYWNKVAEAMSMKLKQYISTQLGSLFDASVITADATVGAITKANIAKLRESCKGRVADTVLALAPAQYNEVISLFDYNVLGTGNVVTSGMVPGLYGFKAVICVYDMPSGIKGALISSDAIAVASRAVAVADEACYSEVGTATDEFGFAITTLRHGSAAKGHGFINLTTLMGMKVINPDDIVLLK